MDYRGEKWTSLTLNHWNSLNGLWGVSCIVSFPSSTPDGLRFEGDYNWVNHGGSHKRAGRHGERSQCERSGITSLEK